MAPEPHLGASHSSQNLRAWAAYPPTRIPPSASSVSLLLPQSASLQSFSHASRIRSSGTWTTSSGELGLLSNADEIEDRDVFVQEYNRLAKKHGVRLLINEDFDAHQRGDGARFLEKRGWFSRILRSNPVSTSHNNTLSPQPAMVRHKRSVSDFANMIHCKRESPKILEIQDMVRLSGKSILYLPQEYAPCSLILPTCIRATAQYLAQHVATRGLFRVPGASKIITALFNYYCYMDNGNANIASTVRCATLPIHIQYSVHDVASTFKRLLSVIPGGVLGSLSLFDAFIAIHSQLNGEPEYPRTKQTKVRARLIALAIGTIKSQYRREMICAVFGLLSLIGRIAEVSPREDEDGRPLPTADLMGYNALGIVFGPLLIGDLLNHYTMKVVTPSTGMLLFPMSPPKLRKERRKSAHIDLKVPGPPAVDKILVANGIAEMLVANWRDVVRQMKSLGTHCRKDGSMIDLPGKNDSILDPHGLSMKTANIADGEGNITPTNGFRKQRQKAIRKAKSHRLLPKMSTATLSPTKEESLGDNESSEDSITQQKRESVIQRLQKIEKKRKATVVDHVLDTPKPQNCLEGRHILATLDQVKDDISMKTIGPKTCVNQGPVEPLQVYIESIPPRESSRQLKSPEEIEKLILPCSCNNHTKERLSNLQTIDQEKTQSYCTSRDNVDLALQSPKYKSSKFNTLLNPIEVSKGGIRVVDASPTNGGHKNEEANMSMDFQRPADLDSNSPIGSKDQGVQCSISEDIKRGNSINTTPERFYHSQQARKEAQQSNDAYTYRAMRHNKPTTKKPALLRNLRLSKSCEQLTTQARITFQSPTDSSESKTVNKQSSVKAMAAMFESQMLGHELLASTEDSDVVSKRARAHSRQRHTKSEPAWSNDASDLTLDDIFRPKSEVWVSRIQQMANLQDAQGILNHLNSNFGASQNIEANGQTKYLLLTNAHSKPETKREKSIAGATGNDFKVVPSLGTIIPCPEQPPIAYHLNLARPSSSPLPVQKHNLHAALDVVPTPQTSRPRSATILYSQIRKLQRQLDLKTDEVAQLRRQLEAQQDSDVGTVSEQLREAKRDASMWKERAETAERRVKVFEKFTEKLKEIRDTMADSKLHKVAENRPHRPRQSSQTQKVDGETNIKSSDLTIVTSIEDEPSVVAAKLRMCLHDLSAAQDGACDYPHLLPSMTPGEEPSCRSQCDCLESRTNERSEQIWAAAEELLHMECDRDGRC